MKKVVFIGYAVGKEYESKLNGISIAGNKMQSNIINGLGKCNDIIFSSITIFPVAPYPKDKYLFISKKMLTIKNTVKSTRISFINVPILKQILQILNTYIECKKIVDKDTILLTYNLAPQTGIPSIFLKKRYKCKICSIFADPPDEIYIGRKNFIQKIKWHLYHFLIMKCIDNCDEFIALNKYAITKYAPDKPYLIMEGGYDNSNRHIPNFRESGKKNVVYSGYLSEYSGVMTLIKAMEIVCDKNVYLEIYGKGPLEEEIIHIANEKKNVRFYGMVDNDTMQKIQQEAFLLVNPRKTEDDISKTTFPSKMFEYMASGTPTLVTKLNAFTKEYLECLFTVEEETPEGFAIAINKIIQLDEKQRMEKARRAYEYICDEKNWDKQNKKIIDYLIR